MSDKTQYVRQNAVEVIEKFGGIRPMASKLGVAVTTIQGWKKREAIPDARIEDIIRAAAQNNITLSAAEDQDNERPNIQDAIATIKAKIEEPKEDQEQPDEELMEFSEEEEDEREEGQNEEDEDLSSEENSRESPEDDTSEKIAPYDEDILMPKSSGQNEETTGNKVENIIPEPFKELPSFMREEVKEEIVLREMSVAETPSQERISEKPSEPEKDVKQTTEAQSPASQKPSAANDVEPAVAAPPQKRASGGGFFSWILLLLFLGGVGGLAAVFWPVKEEVEQNADRIERIETQLTTLQNEQESFLSSISGLVPEEVQAQIETFQETTEQLGSQLGNLAAQTESLSNNVIGVDNTEAIKQRLSALENQFSGLVSGSEIQSILGRFSQMNDTEEGQAQLDLATNQLYGIIGSLEGRMDLLDEALIIARDNSTALGETFTGLPDDDLTAGALLLALTQFRSSLNRDNTPFQEDLALLYSMVGEENTELRAALDRLAPQAESGVLTTEGLSNEFRSMAGDLAVSALKGEEISITEQAGARLSQVLQIRKDGENLIGPKEDERIQTVQTQLDTGDLQGALSTLSTFSGPSATTLKPFMQKLESSIAARDVSAALSNMLRDATGTPRPLNLKNPSANSLLINPLNPPARIIKDEESGVTTMERQNRLQPQFKNLNLAPQE